MRRAAAALLIAATGTVASSGLLVGAARAATESTAPLSLAPAAGAAGASGAALQLSLQPGVTQASAVALSDHSATTTFTVSLRATGAASAWIALRDTVVVVAPGESTNLPLTIAVPAEAPAGPTAAAITADVTSASPATSGASQSLSVPIAIQVGGTPAPSLTIGDVRSQVRKGRHEVVIAVDNAGGIAADGDGILDVPALRLERPFRVHVGPRSRAATIIEWVGRSNETYDVQVTVAYSGANEAMWSGRLRGDGTPAHDAVPVDGESVPVSRSPLTTASAPPTSAAPAAGGGSGSPSPTTLLIALGAIAALVWLGYELLGSRTRVPVPFDMAGIDDARFATPPLSDELGKLASAIEALTATLAAPRDARDGRDAGDASDARDSPATPRSPRRRPPVPVTDDPLVSASVHAVAPIAAEPADARCAERDPLSVPEPTLAPEPVTASAPAPIETWRTPERGALETLKAAAEIAATAPFDRDDQLARIHAVLSGFVEHAALADAPDELLEAELVDDDVDDASTGDTHDLDDAEAPDRGATMVSASPVPTPHRAALMAEVALGLGISEATLCRWVPEDAFDAEPDPIDPRDGDAIARLRHANRVLALQNEVLKRALSRVAE